MSTPVDGKWIPLTLFKKVSIEVPDAIPLGAAFSYKVTFNGDPNDAFWKHLRDHTYTYKIDGYGDIVGPGSDVVLGQTPGALVTTQDDYTITCNVAAGLMAAKGVYELAGVVTFYDSAGSLVGGVVAYAGDALTVVC